MNPRALERSSDPPRSEALRLDVSTTIGAFGSAASTSASSKSGHVRQQHVKKDDVRSEFTHRRECGGGVAGLVDDREARCLQQPPSEAAEARMVVDNEHRGGHGQIVAHVSKRNLLDFPDLFEVQGKA